MSNNIFDECNQKFDLLKALNNEKIEKKLNVICVISNPCNYKRRIILMKAFINQMLNNQDVNLYVVECIYPKLNQTYQITNVNNPNHLQLKANTILWTKENMINIVVNKLLPQDYKAFAFIDADLEFTNINWATDTLKALNSCDILQPFSKGHTLNKFNKLDNKSRMLYSICYLWLNTNKINYKNNNMNLEINKIIRELGHTGWAWAVTRKGYEQMKGLYDMAIIGGGDSILVRSIICNNFMNILKPYKDCSLEFKKSLYDFQNNCRNLKVGYIHGTLYHYYHGSFENRRYLDRWNIIIKNKYNPYLFLTKNEYGMYEATQFCSESFQNQIINYFKERNEDE
jgi:hypothetical protein